MADKGNDVKPIQLTEKNGVLASVYEGAELLGMAPGTLARMAVDHGMKTPQMRGLLTSAREQRPV